MEQSMKGLVIGMVGVAISFFAYSQTVMSTTQCLTIGLIVLMAGLCVKEGFLPS
ncbi:hypothetical protein AMTRI_Chr06g173820 [Amborella trichopoda]